MNKFIILTVLALLGSQVFAVTDKIITSWYPTNGTSGYNGLEAQVLHVYYTALYVWINTNSIPAYSIGPWSANPNTPTEQDATYRFYRTASENTGTKTATSLGAIGLWLDGVYIYNGYDGTSYNNQGVWRQNAYVYEGISFDSCNGHPDGGGRYHTHVNPACLYTIDSTTHSPLLGFMFDSYPVYGPYGYSSAYDSSSAVKRMETSYQLRDITVRHSLSNGTTLSSAYYGPDVSVTSLGSYLEDYEYVSGLGDLDEYNGRWCVTPEFPDGTYAYFITLDEDGEFAYPYIMGPYYYGNSLSQSGSANVPTKATTYF